MKNVISCLVVCVLSGATFATTWTVDDDGKADFDNIQAAVDAASDGDEILVAPGTYTSTSDNVVNTLGKNVWLHSSHGPELTIIDGQGLRRGILTNSGETTQMVIEGFTVQNGNAEVGGGMSCIWGSQPTLKNCVFRNNVADYGGGMRNEGDTTLIDCTFEDNTASGNGGGIDNPWGGSPTFVRCSFISNTAGSNGGGILNWKAGTSEFIECTFIGNIANRGGGVHSYNCTNTILFDCTFDGNEAELGGGIYSEGGTLSIDSCVFTDHAAGAGGGLYSYGTSVTVTGSDFLGNSVYWDGGGIDANWGDLVVNACRFDNNQANFLGGGISIYGTSTEITDCSISENIAGQTGGGLQISETVVTVTDSLFCANLPDHVAGDITGSGIEFLDVCPATWTVDDDGKADFDNIQAAVNAASDGDEILVYPGTYTGDGYNVIDLMEKSLWLHSSDGPAATIIDGEYERRGILYENIINGTIEGFTIQNCRAEPFDYGSGIYQLGGGIFVFSASIGIHNCIIDNNDTTGSGLGWGAGVYCQWSNEIVVTDCTFTNNRTDRSGGGLAILDSTVQMNDCTFDNNDTSGANLGWGGGFYTSNTDATYANCTFTNNTADRDAAGIFHNYSTFELDNCSIKFNTAVEGGGGLALQNGSGIATQCTISHNTAVTGLLGTLGAGILNYQGEITLADTTVCGNTPDQIYGDWTDNGGNTVADECPIDCPDINGDGNVDVSDLLIVIAYWGSSDSPADLNEDGIVDVSDLLIVIGSWGPCE